jgi:hypothetical protein
VSYSIVPSQAPILSAVGGARAKRSVHKAVARSLQSCYRPPAYLSCPYPMSLGPRRVMIPPRANYGVLDKRPGCEMVPMPDGKRSNAFTCWARPQDSRGRQTMAGLGAPPGAAFAAFKRMATLDPGCDFDRCSGTPMCELPTVNCNVSDLLSEAAQYQRWLDQYLAMSTDEPPDRRATYVEHLRSWIRHYKMAAWCCSNGSALFDGNSHACMPRCAQEYQGQSRSKPGMPRRRSSSRSQRLALRRRF